MTNYLAAFITLSTLTACGPCVDDGSRAGIPGPGGPVIIANGQCEGGDDATGIATGTTGDTDAPTDTSEGTDSASSTSDESTGGECPFVPCDMNGVCPAGTGTCMQDQCLITCPCQADPGECAVSFGGPVTFCPAAAAPSC